MSTLDVELFESLRDEHDLRDVVETGSGDGTTTLKLAEMFGHVWTIELDKARFERTVGRTAHLGNVTALFGDTREVIPSILPALRYNMLWWLDAHYCGGGSAGVDDECPLMGELDQIGNLWHKGKHVIVIDDARMFLPDRHGPGHNWDLWPTLEEIRQIVTSFPGPVPSMTQVGDSIVIVGGEEPLMAKGEFLTRLIKTLERKGML